MSTHSFSIAADFPSGLNETALADELRYDYSFDSLVGIQVDGDVCSITFDVDLTAEQITSLGVAVAAHTGQPRPFTKKHYEQEFTNARLTRETWWARASGTTLSLKVEETIYTYAGSRLITEQLKTYNRDGSVAETRTWNFWQEKVGTTLRVRKVEQ